MAMITISILNDWRSGFFLFILWLLLEDLARKYVQLGTAPYFFRERCSGSGQAFFSLFWLPKEMACSLRCSVLLFFVPLALFFCLALAPTGLFLIRDLRVFCTVF